MPPLIASLTEQAKVVRKHLLTMIHKAGAGHPGGSLSAADIVTALYFNEMDIRPDEPDWRERDRFILSKGHCCPVVYTALAMRGFFPMEELYTLRELGSRLQGHPDMRKVPGLDMTTGSLGQGLSAGVGMAVSAKRDNLPSRVFVVLGDGETQEGQIWEAAMTAARYKLDNLVAIVDRNRIQNDDFVANLMPVDPMEDKWRAFNWEVFTVDGHDMAMIVDTFSNVRDCKGKGKPVVIVANTVKGKGVSFMENDPAWHGAAPTAEQLVQACAEIDAGFTNGTPHPNL